MNLLDWIEYLTEEGYSIQFERKGGSLTVTVHNKEGSNKSISLHNSQKEERVIKTMVRMCLREADEIGS